MFYLFPRAISKKECKKLLKYCIKHTEFTKALILNKDEADVGVTIGRVDPKIRKTDIAFVEPNTMQEDNKVNEIAWEYLNTANNRMFNYKIDSFQAVQFARYRDGGHYDWHRDVNENTLVPNGESRKLSLTFSLTDPDKYEGCELQFFTGGSPHHDILLSDGEENFRTIKGEQVPEEIRAQGSIIVFDSRDWHRVTPVTKGTRYSIVCWSVGPNFL